MFNSFRYIGMTTATIIAATAIGTGISCADAKKLISAKLQNKLPVGVDVMFDGTNVLTGPYEFAAGANRPLGSAPIPEGTVLKWTAVPIDKTKSPFTKCTGSQTIGTGISGDTVVLNGDHCEKVSAAPVPPKSPENKSSGASNSSTVDITIENKSKYYTEIWSWDNKSTSPGKETVSVASGGRHNYTVTKDKDGSINFSVSTHCQKPNSPYSSGDIAEYKKAVINVSIEDKSDDYKDICKLTPKP